MCGDVDELGDLVIYKLQSTSLRVLLALGNRSRSLLDTAFDLGDGDCRNKRYNVDK